MTQRRTPSGQGPSRRPVAGRGAIRSAGRVGAREPAARVRAATRAVPTARAGSRPALARRTAATGTTRRTAAPQPRRFTGRAAILAAVFVVLALGYTYPVRVYLAQKSDIARMEAATAAKEARIAELTEEAAKWQDDEYVKTQARKRFFYVRPGEVPLIVMDDPEGAARDAGRATSAPPPPARWYDTLWSSIEAADRTS